MKERMPVPDGYDEFDLWRHLLCQKSLWAGVHLSVAAPPWEKNASS